MEELDIIPAEENDIVDLECPNDNCNQTFTDNCPPDYDMENEIKCPSCGIIFQVKCNVTIEREYESYIE